VTQGWSFPRSGPTQILRIATPDSHPSCAHHGVGNSPPLFCSLTETICDLGNARMCCRHAPAHQQESLAARDDVIDETGLTTSDSVGDAQVSELCPESQDQVSDPKSADTSQRSAPAQVVPPPTKPLALQHAPTSCEEDKQPFSALPAPEQAASNKPLPKPLANADIFVDDFILAVQGNHHRRKVVRRILMNAIDEVLKSPDDLPGATEPISDKKLGLGNGSLNPRKLILGWLIEALKTTLELPLRQQQHILSLLAEFLGRK